MFFQSALGEWDYGIYDDVGSEGKRWFGVLFHTALVIVNMMLMVNLVIAIMTDTYRIYQDEKLGLFS